jgi:hypothetical protein
MVAIAAAGRSRCQHVGMAEPEAAAREAERQLAAAAERHRELVAAVAVAGRPDQGRHAAATALARGVQLLAFTLTRAAAAGVPRERLVELTGGDASLVDDALDRGADASVVERLTPGGVDPHEVAQAVASLEASARVGAVVQTIMADVEDAAWSPAAADLDDLADRLEDVWRRWRQALGRRDA